MNDDFRLEELNTTRFDTLTDFVYYMVNVAVSLSILLVVAMIIMAGFKYITSGGDNTKVQAATRSLLFSIIGFVLVFLSPAIVNFVMNNMLGAK